MRSRISAFGIAAFVFLLDRLTKWWIESTVSVWDTLVVIPNFFNIVHTKNKGIAFGIMNDSSGASRTLVLIVISGAVLVFVGYTLWRLHPDASAMLRTGMALIFGGALGNLWDRVLAGSVTDFLEFYAGSFVWPAFNVADSAICVGAGLMILDLLMSRRQEARA